MKKTIVLTMMTLMACGTIEAQQVNDSNTPLHLMQPQYETAYGVPAPHQVKQTMDRILHYLEQATPAMLVDGRSGKEVKVNGIDAHTHLAKGDFRLTSYEWGVTYSAMLAAAQATGDAAYRRYAVVRMQLLADAAPAFSNLHRQGKTIDPLMRKVVDPHALDDAGAICAAMIKAKVADTSLRLDDQIAHYADFVMNKEYRLSDGTFARMRPQYNTVWLDDMFMGVPTVAWMGRFTGDTRYYDQAADLVAGFAKRMWVDANHLFRHGWVEAMQPHPSFHWGRANGWALLAMSEVLDALPKDHARRPEVLALFREHVAGLAPLQGKNGYWHQLLDRPDTYEESSCTAIFTYCMAHAICEGWISAQAYGPTVLLGWQAVARSVNAKGQVEGTCVGTGMGFDAAFYAYRPVHVMAAHGYGPALWAGAEVIRLLKTQHPKMNDSAVQFYDREVPTDEPIFNYDGKIRY